MSGSEMGGATFSLQTLQRVQRSFDEVNSLGAAQERAIMNLVRQLGAVCVPVCIRAIRAAGKEHGERVQWGLCLLGHLAGAAEHRMAVCSALEALVREPGIDGSVRLQVTGLLRELGGEMAGSEIRSRAGGVPEILRSDALLDELAGLLSSAPDIARAADMLVCDMPDHEMLDILDQLCAHKPRQVLRLLCEILLRSDIGERARREIKRLRAPLLDRQKRTETRPPGRQPVATVSMGRHASGRFVVIASRHIGHQKQRRHRVLSLFIARDGVLSHGTYREKFPRGHVERELLPSLRAQGYRFETVSVVDAGYMVIRAAQTTRQIGRPVPRAFYLGRDLLDIYDEHITGLDADDDRGALLDRAFELLAAEQPDRARPLFERYVAQAPNSADGCAGMAMCLLALGDTRRARPHLRRAAWLEPDNPNHHWNLSAIAHSQERLGECYLQLIDYLSLCDEFDQAPGNASQRRVQAALFVREYERIARVEFPGTDPIDVAQADDLVFHARQHMQSGQYENAIAVLEQAVQVVPDHYPALACLCIAYAECSRADEARSYLNRAMALRPGFAMIREAHQRLERLAPVASERAHHPSAAPMEAPPESPDTGKGRHLS